MKGRIDSLSNFVHDTVSVSRTGSIPARPKSQPTLLTAQLSKTAGGSSDKETSKVPDTRHKEHFVGISNDSATFLPATEQRQPPQPQQHKPASSRHPKSLQGFKRIERKPSYYVYGVRIGKDIDETLDLVNSYLVEKGVTPTLVRPVKQGSKYVSFKINVVDDKELDSQDFWPEGVGCRKWVYPDKE